MKVELRVSPARVADIVKRLDPDVLTIGVFRDEMPERVVEIVRRADAGLYFRLMAPVHRVVGICLMKQNRRLVNSVQQIMRLDQ